MLGRGGRCSLWVHGLVTAAPGRRRGSALVTVSGAGVLSRIVAKLGGTLGRDALQKIVAVDTLGHILAVDIAAIGLHHAVLGRKEHTIAGDVVALELAGVAHASGLDVDFEDAQTVDAHLVGALHLVAHDLDELGQTGLHVRALQRAVALDDVADVVQVHHVGVDGAGEILAKGLVVLHLVLIQTIIN